MKIGAVLLGLSLAAGWDGPARAGEVQPDFASLESGQDARETYRLNAFEVVHEQMSGVFPTIFAGRGNWWRPVRGKFRYATSYDDFFLKVGRADLRDQHHQRRVLSSTVFWSGAAVSIGGLALMLSGLAAHHDTRAEIGLGVFAGGVVTTSIGSAIQPPLVNEDDALEMTRAYNRLLQVHLGLSPVGSGPQINRLSIDRLSTGRLPIALSLSRGW